MTNPYDRLPEVAFWRRSVAEKDPDDVDPVLGAPFAISRTDWVATAGSCFAQQISRAIVAEGFRFLVTETAPRSDGAVDENYGVFPARFANLYTPRALLQLFQRAYGVFEPREVAWLRADGRWVDPFRPRIQAAGFETPAALVADREVHFAAVRAMFERTDVFVFTMGLTEAWASPRDGAVFPLAGGVVAEHAPKDASTFVNFSVAEMTQDLLKFITYVRCVNPDLRIILTVSPVPIIATFEPRHVLVSSVFTKSALRVVADEVSRAVPDVVYFPSYEMVAGPQARGRFYADNLRAVTPEGVAFVMDNFRRHFLGARPGGATTSSPRAAPASTASVSAAATARSQDATQRLQTAVSQRMAGMQALVCEEEALDPAPLPA